MTVRTIYESAPTPGPGEASNPESEATRPSARLLALYLPQFHPIPENDAWWGRGFTEWTNTAKAKPLFRGHYQPHIPADLGFYDLRVPETRQAQADMARSYGIEAFCYYHYWFAGRRILERVFDEVLKSREPDFPFCLCWANQSWTGVWHGAPDRILIEQTYPGYDDHRAHFDAVLPAFLDPRYVRVGDQPLFCVFRPSDLPEPHRATDLWRNLARKAGLAGLHLVGMCDDPDWNPKDWGFDASTAQTLPDRNGPGVTTPFGWARHKYHRWTRRPTIYAFEDVLPILMPVQRDKIVNYPCLVHSWDNSPRSGREGLVLRGSTPEHFRKLLRRALELRAGEPREKRIVFLKSWNEWAEGNHLEPDLEFGTGYLDVIRDEVFAPLSGLRRPAHGGDSFA